MNDPAPRDSRADSCHSSIEPRHASEAGRSSHPKGTLAFLTTDSLEGFVVYDRMAIEPLRELGWTVVEVSWRAPAVCWDDFAAVLIRTPWDYHRHCDEFLRVLETIDASKAVLLNPLPVVRWNIDKRYLRDLEQAGLSIVPTLWPTSPTLDVLEGAMQVFGCDELVVKPTIGAGAIHTYRVRKEQFGELEASITDSYSGRLSMVQPFLASITSAGEWSLFFFGGRYSHAVVKTPKQGDFRVQEEFGSKLVAVEPTPELMALGAEAVAFVGEPLVYARVDMVMLASGRPAIMELELIEPSLYFPYDVESPRRFAHAVDERLATIDQVSGTRLASS